MLLGVSITCAKAVVVSNTQMTNFQKASILSEARAVDSTDLSK